MGSSKKHKEKDKEHKRKRKHRSRSRSREREREGREGKRRHRERDEGNGYQEYYEPDREEGELDDVHAQRQQPSGGASGGGGGGDMSLSIVETNKLRAKMGMKPLEMPGKGPDTTKESLKDDIHKPAENWGHVKKSEKIKEKLERSKMKRDVSSKLSKVKTLGESDSDEDAATWVRKNRMKQREKDKADKTARMLEEMDAEFGISSLVQEEFSEDIKKTARSKNYTSKHLKGLNVQHDISRFKEGQTVILTLQDKGILDEDEEETLINVNMEDTEKSDKNTELRKKKPDYNPYDEGDVDEYGMLKTKEVLDKYDEEIEGERKKTFKLGAGGKYDGQEDRQMERITQALRAQSQTLSSTLNLASEYMTTDEVNFKKVKKKVRKIRKKPKILKADDLLPLPVKKIKKEPVDSRYTDEGQSQVPGLDLVKTETDSEEEGDNIMVDSDDDVDVDDLAGFVLEDDAADLELQSALSKARKVKQKRDKKNPEKLAVRIVSEEMRVDEELESPSKEGLNITLNVTSEFCRAMGDIPTYGQSGNREEIEKQELEELEKEMLEQRRKQEEEEDEPTGWNRVEIDETPVNIDGEDTAILEDEPVINRGLAGALTVAVNKGFLEHEEIKHKLSKKMEEMLAQNYSIEDKSYNDLDEKYKKRDRYSGMLSEFKEKPGYKPEVTLEYCDETGRNLNRKEAFRQLSHRFHGKGSGKKKTEKRSKKVEEEQLFLKMNAADTPLNTVALLKDKQAQEKTPYIILSGNKGFTHTITKPST